MEAVYIFENKKAKLVKVGITHLWTTSVKDRLIDLNNQWSEKKVTCQICGYKRYIDASGLIKKHIVSGRICPGGNEPPLEKNTSLAQKYLQDLNVEKRSACGNEKSSITRKVNTIKRRIKIFEQQEVLVGKFSIILFFILNLQKLLNRFRIKSLQINFSNTPDLEKFFIVPFLML